MLGVTFFTCSTPVFYVVLRARRGRAARRATAEHAGAGRAPIGRVAHAVLAKSREYQRSGRRRPRSRSAVRPRAVDRRRRPRRPGTCARWASVASRRRAPLRYVLIVTYFGGISSDCSERDAHPDREQSRLRASGRVTTTIRRWDRSGTRPGPTAGRVRARRQQHAHVDRREKLRVIASSALARSDQPDRARDATRAEPEATPVSHYGGRGPCGPMAGARHEDVLGGERCSDRRGCRADGHHVRARAGLNSVEPQRAQKARRVTAAVRGDVEVRGLRASPRTPRWAPRSARGAARLALAIAVG